MPPTTTAVNDTSNLGEGDSYLVLDLLPEDENWMEKLKQEVQFRVMLHRGAVDVLVLFSILIAVCRGRGSATGRGPRRDKRGRKVIISPFYLAGSKYIYLTRQCATRQLPNL